jgi:signal peptidase I
MDDTEKKEAAPWWQIVTVGRKPRYTLVRIFVLVIICFVVFKFVLIPIKVEGPSMLPTYKSHRVNFVNRLAYLRHEPQRGDVVAIKTSGESIMFMKRIVGMPGETIEFRDGHAIIDGKVLPEPYVQYPCHWEADPQRVPEGWYYFVGDNRSMPQSDHYQGKAERWRIVGKVLL